MATAEFYRAKSAEVRDLAARTPDGSIKQELVKLAEVGGRSASSR
jgi:hypothetical protein